jgi:beta-hydroxylase
MFVDRAQFPFVARLEAAWTTIRDECLALGPDDFEPWVQREMYGEGWHVYGLLAFGRRVERGLAACPETAALVESVPGVTTAGFSRLAAGAHIEPHVGWVRTVYRMHLGLVVPDGCTLRVGDETRPWREGEGLIFDDTTEHEAHNRSPHDRIVLLLDFLRPGVDPALVDLAPPEVQRMVDEHT